MRANTLARPDLFFGSLSEFIGWVAACAWQTNPTAFGSGTGEKPVGLLGYYAKQRPVTVLFRSFSLNSRKKDPIFA
jgi:hypothetical protein